MHTGHLRIVFAALAISAGAGMAAGESVDLAAFSRDVKMEPAPIQVAGQDTKVWETSPQNRVLTFQPSVASDIAPSSGTLFLQVTYLDRGYGRLAVRYVRSDGKTVKPEKFTQIVLSDSGRWRTSYLELSGLAESGIPGLQISLEQGQGNPLIISKASLQTTPFTDAHFQYLLQEAWKRP